MLLYLTKRAVFTRWPTLKGKGTLFLYKVIVTKMCFTKLSPEISHELLQTTLNFIINVFHLEFYYKNQLHGSNQVPSNIFHHQSRHNFNFSYLPMESEPGLIFKIISSWANLNLRTKFESFSIANSWEKRFNKNYTLITL